MALDFDDTNSFDGLSNFGFLVIFVVFGLGGYVAYTFGYQKGLDNAGKCINSQTQCKVVEKELGTAKYKIIENKS